MFGLSVSRVLRFGSLSWLFSPPSRQNDAVGGASSGVGGLLFLEAYVRLGPLTVRGVLLERCGFPIIGGPGKHAGRAFSASCLKAIESFFRHRSNMKYNLSFSSSIIIALGPFLLFLTYTGRSYSSSEECSEEDGTSSSLLLRASILRLLLIRRRATCGSHDV